MFQNSDCLLSDKLQTLLGVFYYLMAGAEMQKSVDLTEVQLSTSSLAIHGGAIFSAVSGRKSIPISAIGAPEHGACYRVHGFYLTTTFCSTLAQQAVSN